MECALVSIIILLTDQLSDKCLPVTPSRVSDAIECLLAILYSTLRRKWVVTLLSAYQSALSQARCHRVHKLILDPLYGEHIHICDVAMLFLSRHTNAHEPNTTHCLIAMKDTASQETSRLCKVSEEEACGALGATEIRFSCMFTRQVKLMMWRSKSPEGRRIYQKSDKVS